MRFLLSLISVLAGLAFATQASARGIPIIYGSSDKMSFVSETEIFEAGQPLALCALWSRQHFFYVGYWGSQKYVLAENNCDADSYFFYTTEEIIEDRVAGIVPASIPNEPQLTIRFVAYCFTIWGAVGLIFLIWANGALADRSKLKRRRKLLGDVHPFVERMIAVMTHAARSDGNISDVEIDLMRKTVSKYSNKPVTDEDILRVINITPKIRTDAQFKDLGRGLDAEGRQQMFYAGLAMISADGVLEKSERKWLSRLGSGLGYKGREIRAIFKELDNQTA